MSKGMEFQKFLFKSDFIKYYFSEYEEPEDFKKIDKIIRKNKKLKARPLEYLEGFSFLMKKYSIFGCDIYLYNDHMTGNYLTIKRKEDEAVLEIVIAELKSV